MFGLFKKDPEVIKILDSLMKRLENLDDWERESNDFIRHRHHNIKIDQSRISDPKHMWITRRYGSYRKIIKAAVKTVHRNHKVNEYHFMNDVISGAYPHQMSMYSLNDEQKAWLQENGEENDYLHRDHWLYFVDEPLAMAFKLRFD